MQNEVQKNTIKDQKKTPEIVIVIMCEVKVRQNVHEIYLSYEGFIFTLIEVFLFKRMTF